MSHLVWETTIGAGWVLPHWLERQSDPGSPAFVPRAQLDPLRNVTDRNWTRVGNLDSPWEAVVDPRGLVTPWPGGWSLDWWIGADDRWHVPAREASVRQRLLEGAPVVETRMRVPGGDAVARTYAVRTPAEPGRAEGEELVVVEIANETRAPFAVALGLRPYNHEGLVEVSEVELRVEAGSAVVLVDGRPGLLLPKAPGRVAASAGFEGDSATLVFGGHAVERYAGPLRCPHGMAQLAVVLPLAHGAALRVAMPLTPPRAAPASSPGARRRSGRVANLRRRRRGDAASTVEVRTLPAALPPAANVAAGWRSQTARGMRLELPDARLGEAVEANRRFLLVLHDGPASPRGAGPDRGSRFPGAAFMAVALDQYGFHQEAARLLSGHLEAQRVNGSLGGSADRHATAAAAVLWALAQHWHLARDRALLDANRLRVAGAARWVRRAGRVRLRRDVLGGRYSEDLWAVAGLRAASELLVALDEHEGAADALAGADTMWADLTTSWEAIAGHRDPRAGPTGTFGAAIPAGPDLGPDADLIEVLAAAWPLGLVPADDPRLLGTAEVVRERFSHGPAVVAGTAPSGLGTLQTLQLAGLEVAGGDRRALKRLAWLLEAAGPTWTWPQVVHPRLGTGCVGDGHDRVVSAEVLSLVRAMVVREVPGGLALASLVPDTWLGRGWEVHDAPTAAGRLSYAVRWHGERPALLWELDPHPGPGEVRLSAPGLDPTWSSDQPRGEALLGAPGWAGAARGGAVAEPGALGSVEPGGSFG